MSAYCHPVRKQVFFFFFFFCIQSYISGVHHYHSSSSAFKAISLGFTILLLLSSQLYPWGSTLPFFFFCIPAIYLWGSSLLFCCVPSHIPGVHHYHSSSSEFPAISLGFTILLLHPSYISGVHHSSSSSGFNITILLLLHSQLYLWGSPFFFF